LSPKWAWSGSREQFLHFGLRKFRHSKSSVYRCYKRQRSACGLHLRRSSASWLNEQVYYTSVYCNPLNPLLRFVLDLSYKLYLHYYAAVDIIRLTRRVARSFCDSRASCIVRTCALSRIMEHKFSHPPPLPMRTCSILKYFFHTVSQKVTALVHYNFDILVHHLILIILTVITKAEVHNVSYVRG